MLDATTAKNSVIFQETAIKEIKEVMLLATTVRRKAICQETAKVKVRRLVTNVINLDILQEIVHHNEIN